MDEFATPIEHLPPITRYSADDGYSNECTTNRYEPDK